MFKSCEIFESLKISRCALTMFCIYIYIFLNECKIYSIETFLHQVHQCYCIYKLKNNCKKESCVYHSRSKPDTQALFKILVAISLYCQQFQSHCFFHPSNQYPFIPWTFTVSSCISFPPYTMQQGLKRVLNQKHLRF